MKLSSCIVQGTQSVKQLVHVIRTTLYDGCVLSNVWFSATFFFLSLTPHSPSFSFVVYIVQSMSETETTKKSRKPTGNMLKKSRS